MAISSSSHSTVVSPNRSESKGHSTSTRVVSYSGPSKTTCRRRDSISAGGADECRASRAHPTQLVCGDVPGPATGQGREAGRGCAVIMAARKIGRHTSPVEYPDTLRRIPVATRPLREAGSQNLLASATGFERRRMGNCDVAVDEATRPLHTVPFALLRPFVGLPRMVAMAPPGCVLTSESYLSMIDAFLVDCSRALSPQHIKEIGFR
ncbi:uncharacterized protein B0T15DRAFT_577810 [Chaetomium strumarium]|uniref:Uncharacterized protein n=1 Tax=Chaetomium strumarium TaxID=1170767 RepID=A0AAJ0GML7_9PEZI|nr:hypothetical protein B0T15DRAFT_577810 [Chaetomium strumarium]